MAPTRNTPDQPEEGVAVQERPATKRPRRYRVLLHNDDYTTMDFVVWVLMQYFHKNRTEATHIMLQVHSKGVGTCGSYARDVAETKVENVNQAARENGHPLQCTMEPETD